MVRPFVDRVREKARTQQFSSFTKGSAWAFGIRLTGMGVSYLFTVTVTRGFGADTMGIFSLCQTLLMVSVLLGRFGLDTALLRFISEFRGQGKEGAIPYVYSRVLTLLFPWALFLTLLVVFLAPWLAETVFQKPDIGPYMRVMALGILPMVFMFVNSESIRALKKVREALVIRTVTPFGIGLLAVLAWWGGSSPSIPVGGYVAGLVLSSIAGFILWRKYGIREKGDKGNAYSYRQMIRTGGPMLLAGSMFLIMNWTDVFMLGIFQTKSDVGVYHVAMKLAGLNTLSLFAVNMVAAPRFSEFYWQGDMKGLNKVVRRATNMAALSVIPLMLGFLFFAKPIMDLFGEGFASGSRTLVILALSQFINAASGSVMYILQMTGKEKVGHRILMGGGGLNIALNYLLIPAYGLEGAAVASLVSQAFWNITAGIYIKRKYGILTFFWPFPRKP